MATVKKRGGSGLAASIQHTRKLIARIERGNAHDVGVLMKCTGLSRSQVFNLLRQLRDVGVKISKERGQPYLITDKGPFK